MHPSTLTVLFASTAAAQSTVTIFNLFRGEKTLTLKGSDKSTATYVNACSSSAADVPAVPTLSTPSNAPSSNVPTPAVSSAAPQEEPSDLAMVPLSALPTGRAGIRRQVDMGLPNRCEPYTLIQGPENWEFHLTDPVPGAWTMDAACNWKGDVKTADLTCTATQTGEIPQNDGTSTMTLVASEVAGFGALQAVTIANPTAATSGGSTGPTSVTNSTGGSVAPTGSTPTQTTAESTGLAAPTAFPAGAMVWVGGAAGIFAAALAL